MSCDIIPTKALHKKPNSALNFASIKYESHKKKKVAKSESSQSENKTAHPTSEFNIKKAKHDIVKFGMSGFDPEKKQEAKIQLAIKLGAKPPKNKYKNYKLLKEERLKQKEEEKRKLQFSQLGKNAQGKSLVKSKIPDRKKRKNKDGLLDVYGKIIKSTQ